MLHAANELLVVRAVCESLPLRVEDIATRGGGNTEDAQPFDVQAWLDGKVPRHEVPADDVDHLQATDVRPCQVGSNAREKLGRQHCLCAAKKMLFLNSSHHIRNVVCKNT